MITRSTIAFEDFLGSSIAPQVMPPWIGGNTFLGLEEILEQLEVEAEEQRAPMGRRLSTVTTFTKL